MPEEIKTQPAAPAAENKPAAAETKEEPKERPLTHVAEQAHPGAPLVHREQKPGDPDDTDHLTHTAEQAHPGAPLVHKENQ